MFDFSVSAKSLHEFGKFIEKIEEHRDILVNDERERAKCVPEFWQNVLFCFVLGLVLYTACQISPERYFQSWKLWLKTFPPTTKKIRGFIELSSILKCHISIHIVTCSWLEHVELAYKPFDLKILKAEYVTGFRVIGFYLWKLWLSMFLGISIIRIVAKTRSPGVVTKTGSPGVVTCLMLWWNDDILTM